jgi:hypothetical protein
MSQKYFYDGQLRRFLVQFIRIVSNFEVEFGKDRDGTRTLQRVPVYYGDASRQAQVILKGNSENTLNAVPAMAAYISGLTYEQSRMQEPNFVSKMNLRMREYDATTGLYSGNQGDSYTIERLMPVPYKLTMKLDIWTSNTEQKMQLIEQIAVLFNPSLEIQSTDNYIDWTSLSFVQLTELLWTSRVIPAGAEESIDIATLTFDMPIWISSPAKVKRLGVIQKIINSIYDEQGEFSQDTILSNLVGRVTVSPVNYGVYYSGNQLKLLKQHEVALEDGTLLKTAPPETWRAVIEIYGTLVTGASEIRLALPTGTELIGSITYHPTDPSILLFEPIEDTMPSNTLTAVDAIINPTNVIVDSGLLNPAAGTRYLITDNIGSANNLHGSEVWGDLVAQVNDVIEYNSTWQVVFDSQQQSDIQYITNTNTGVQYRWTGSDWVKSVEGVYRGGDWSIVI